MRYPWGRIVGAAVLAEIVPILALVVLVAALGPRDSAGASAYAAEQGRWVGPLVGALSVAILAWMVARRTAAARPIVGLLIGVLAAALDVTILILGETPFEWLFVASNAGRVLAGWLGGTLAGASTHAAQRY
jgi:hypothetical protein